MHVYVGDQEIACFIERRTLCLSSETSRCSAHFFGHLIKLTFQSNFLKSLSTLPFYWIEHPSRNFSFEDLQLINCNSHLTMLINTAQMLCQKTENMGYDAVSSRTYVTIFRSKYYHFLCG